MKWDSGEVRVFDLDKLGLPLGKRPQNLWPILREGRKSGVRSLPQWQMKNERQGAESSSAEASGTLLLRYCILNANKKGRLWGSGMLSFSHFLHFPRQITRFCNEIVSGLRWETQVPGAPSSRVLGTEGREAVSLPYPRQGA